MSSNFEKYITDGKLNFEYFCLAQTHSNEILKHLIFFYYHKKIITSSKNYKMSTITHCAVAESHIYA